MISQSALESDELALDPVHTVSGVTQGWKGITYLATQDWHAETDHDVADFHEMIGRSAAATK